MPRMPTTLKRSSRGAQHLYATVLENAEKQYGSGERASRTAMAALKHSFEKVGDHWERGRLRIRKIKHVKPVAMLATA